MKNILAIVGILCVIGGTLSGGLNWFLGEFYLQSVGWEGPAMILNRAAWLLYIFGMGLGGTLIGLAVLVGSSNKS